MGEIGSDRPIIIRSSRAKSRDLGTDPKGVSTALDTNGFVHASICKAAR